MNNRLLPFQGWRLTFFQGIIFAVFLLFGIRMYDMQVINSTGAQIAADENRLNELPIAADRGVIFDRYFQTLAGNVPAYIVRVTPAELPSDREEELEIFNRLSALTGVPPTRAIANANDEAVASIEEMVITGAGIAPYTPVSIAQDVPLNVALRILEEGYELPGVDIQEAAVRVYPTGESTAHIIGYMGPISPENQLRLIELGYDPNYDRIGYAGIESYMQEELAGTRGIRRREVDVAGQEIRELERIEPVAGLNLRLTIDAELQAIAYQALIDRIAFINAEEGQIVTEQGVIVAMNPNTGELLALVSYPSYDNSRFARAIDVDYYLDVLEDERRPLFNQVISSQYPPGSTFKLFTSAGAIEEDVIAPQTELYDAGDLLVPNSYAPNDPAANQRFVCWLASGHGNVNLREAIAQSCNVYFYQVGGGNPEVSAQTLRSGGLGIANLFRYATAVGIGSQLGVELPGELAGRMPDADWKRITRGENWSTGDTYNASVGQGYVNVTPLQLTAAIASLVNDGTLYKPTLISEYLDAERNVVESVQPQILRTVNPDKANPDGTVTLLLLEDMILQGANSLACTCEPTAETYNPSVCNPSNYSATFDMNPDPFIDDIREYVVHVPEGYGWYGGICDRLRFDPDYVPAFISTNTLDLIHDGMRAAVTEGTATNANLSYVTVAGKTGTAEYCDNIAWALGLCIQGAWPSHAWFAAYASYEEPEILVVGFIYHGDEGSANALPVVVETLEGYYRLKNERQNEGISVASSQTP